MEYETIVSARIVKPKTEPIFSELATTVSLEDEAAGLFVEVSQQGRTDMGKISICPNEWPELRKTIDEMIQYCVKNGDSNG